MSGAPRIERGVARGPAVTFTFDGRRIEAFAGESVAAALLTAGIRHLRDASVIETELLMGEEGPDYQVRS